MFRSLLVAAVLAASVVPAAAETQSRVLANGMKVIVREDHRAPVAVTQLWFKVGSADEHAGKTGLSHALEHMMFKGTPTVPAGEFSRRISALGGSDNAFTSRNETVYHQEFAVGSLPQVLELEADRMVNLNFSDADFENEMKVIREERRLTTDNDPDGKMWEQAYLAAFTQPSMRASVIGYMKDLHTLKADDLRAWYKQYYAPNNAVLVIVGDVDAKQTLQTAAKLFGDIPAKAQPPRNKLHTEPYLRKPVTVKATSPVTHQPLIAINFRVPKLQKLDDTMPFALDVLSDILAGNASSRFDKNLVRGKQTALSAGTHYDIISREMPLFSVRRENRYSDCPAAPRNQRHCRQRRFRRRIAARQNPSSGQRNLRQRLHVFPSLHDGPPRSARFPIYRRTRNPPPLTGSQRARSTGRRPDVDRRAHEHRHHRAAKTCRRAKQKSCQTPINIRPSESPYPFRRP